MGLEREGQAEKEEESLAARKGNGLSYSKRKV